MGAGAGDLVTLAAWPASLVMLAGTAAMAVSLWRARLAPRADAAALPALWLCEVVLAQAGGGLVAGLYWLIRGRLLTDATPRPAKQTDGRPQTGGRPRGGEM
ncbi:hypothetical protein HII36_16460 [Nonomuraea sp. NN258]|nr:hypothetical protein [Nonomuraea antri]